MKANVVVKLIVVGALLVTAGLLLRGHDVLTAVALVVLLLVVAAKLVCAFVLRPTGFPPGGQGPDSAGRFAPKPPGGPFPAISAAEKINPR